MNKRMRRALALSAAVVLGSSAVTTQAAVGNESVTRSFYNIKVVIDGQYKTPTNEPFMIGDSTYVGLRDFAELTGCKVYWDGATKTIRVESNAGDSTALEAELIEKNLEIAKLASQVKALEEKLAQYEGTVDPDTGDVTNVSSTAIKNMLSYLEDEYEDTHNIEWEFDLTYDTKNEVLNFEVAYDSGYTSDRNEFEDLDADDIDRFLEKMCDDIQDELGEIEIVGELVDTDEDEVLYEFEMSTSGRIKLNKMNTSSSLDDYEDELKDDSDYEHLISLPLGENGAAVGNIDIDDFTLSEEYDFNEITLEIDTDMGSEYENAWESLDDDTDAGNEAIDDLESWFEELADDLIDEFDCNYVIIQLNNKAGKMIAEYEDEVFSHYNF